MLALHARSMTVAALLLASASGTRAEPLGCGFGIRDWCPVPPGDACGRHRNVEACRADPACYGLPYRGESVVSCLLDARGFASNCPTVGCTSAPTSRPSR